MLFLVSAFWKKSTTLKVAFFPAMATFCKFYKIASNMKPDDQVNRETWTTDVQNILETPERRPKQKPTSRTSKTY